MYEQLILKGIKGLSPEALAEITDFIYFIRKRTLHPQAFEDELRGVLLLEDLTQLSRDEADHLEQEFEDYARRYPHE
ncbi:MAG: hypothetical protein KY468_12395 [Armatimonadetes bacterium]|nr:hypothetical protein [Armatimonadota bacterium]